MHILGYFFSVRLMKQLMLPADEQISSLFINLLAFFLVCIFFFILLSKTKPKKKRGIIREKRLNKTSYQL